MRLKLKPGEHPLPGRRQVTSLCNLTYREQKEEASSCDSYKGSNPISKEFIRP